MAYDGANEQVQGKVQNAVLPGQSDSVKWDMWAAYILAEVLS